MSNELPPLPASARTVTRYVTDHYWKAFWPNDEPVRTLPISVYLASDVDPLLITLAEREAEIARLHHQLAERPT